MSTNRRQNQSKQRGTWWRILVLGAVVALVGFLMYQDHIAWQPGELNAQGLRVSGEGRTDASHVLAPEHFPEGRVRDAYTIAQQIPTTLNQLSCWCGCVARGLHRSALECFESRHAANCDVCLGNAEVAWEMIQEGATDPAEIQKTLDARYGRT